MSCCGGAEEDSYGPPANQAVPPPNANAPGTVQLHAGHHQITVDVV
jgi:hypothetical protein